MTGAARTVFLTGAAGAWGRATLREFREREGEYRVIALVRPGRREDAVLEEFAGLPWLELLRGDLRDPVVVAHGVSRADVVLHVGAVVSPLADRDPELTHAVNVGGIRNIVAAVRALPDPSRVAVVGIGSVAETGSRNPPVHWGRVGDPLRVSVFDEYGQSKVIAERELVDSGLPRWTWLRQTGILHPGMVQIRDPIMTHPPLDGVMEWVSDVDSARLLVRLCDQTVPEEIWGGIWNIGGGEPWRLTNWELLDRVGRALGARDIRDWYRRDWFALRNFHGHWYTDSDALQQLVPYREDSVDAALDRAAAALSPAVRSAARLPAWAVRRLGMEPYLRRPRGTLAAIRAGDARAIAAHFGSLEAWRAIGDWSTFEPPQPSRVPSRLDHGYDEDIPSSAWRHADYTGAAAFRGGRLLSEEVPQGEVSVPVEWACADGHRFSASPRLVLHGGHWCPVCIRDPGDYERQAERNAFLAQVLD